MKIYLIVIGIVSYWIFTLINRSNDAYCKSRRNTVIFWVQIVLLLLLYFGLVELIDIAIVYFGFNSKIFAYVVSIFIDIILSGITCVSKSK